MTVTVQPYFSDESRASLNQQEIRRLAYYAGLFDGEGCVSINKVKGIKGRRDSFQLRVNITSTNEEVVRQMPGSFGGTVLFRQRERAQDFWNWVAVARQARDFLVLIKPDLIIKHQQARVGIMFQTERDARGQQKTEEDWNKEFQYYETIRRLNARWGTEYYEGT